MSKPSIPTCCVTSAIPGDGGACGDCDPCIMGEPLVPEAVKRLIAEKNSQISHAADLAGELEASLSREAKLREALEKASGYMTNAAIDLQTGAPKRTALNTIEGGLKMVRDALAQGTPS